MNTNVQKVIELAQNVMSSENTSRDKEYELTSILYDELVSGNRDNFDEIIKATTDIPMALFITSFVNNIASSKTFEKKESGGCRFQPLCYTYYIYSIKERHNK